ncbi:nitroreductase/quinone reductase family protein [Microbacterium sp. P03]|uniref:nitroreductase/quinone reductase family protein n=1 Tax=Microbacterium sp. P03 TaxID=3366946 RepID=UPI0037467E15
MPTTLSMKFMNAVHRGAIAVTRGRFGWDLAGMPVIELTTTGRRSGEARTSMLTAPLAENGGYVIVASRGGDDRHPAWFLNLRDQPLVQVARKRRSAVPMRARILGGAERAEAWNRIVDVFPHYAGYQRKTTREIPLVSLEPLG